MIAYDPYEEINTITPELMEKLENNPNKVKVGLHINNFDKFEMEKNEFTFSGMLFFEFDPVSVSLEKLEKFSFDKGKILEISKPHVRLKGDNVVAIYHIKVSFSTNLNHRLFPIDDHRISIEIDNETLSPYDILFDVSVTRFTLNPDMYISGWSLYNKYVSSGYFLAKLEKDNNLDLYHSRVAFVLEYMRNSVREMISVILPLILLFFVSIFSFAIDPSENFATIVGLSLASVTGMLSYRYVIEKISPVVGYFMVSDIIFFMFFILAILIFFLNSQIFNISLKNKKIISIFMHLIVVFIFIYLIKYAAIW